MLLLIKNGLLLKFYTVTPKKHPFELNLPPTYKYIPENLFLRRSSVELEISEILSFSNESYFTCISCGSVSLTRP